MAKHARQSADETLRNYTAEQPTIAAEPRPSTYVYPDGSTYGAPAGGQDQLAAARSASGNSRSTAAYDASAYVRNTSTSDASAYSRTNTQVYGHASNAYASLVAERRKKRKRKRVAMVVGCILALLLAIGVGGMYFVDKKLAGNTITSEVANKLVPEVADQPFYMLILGSDSREADPEKRASAYQHTDIILLARVDRKKDQVTFVSIPRDTPWHKEDGTVVKINTLYNDGGPATVIDAISQLTGVPISHYAETRFLEFAALVDVLGGVVYDVPIDMKWRDPMAKEIVSVSAGEQLLNGQQATIVMRDRHHYEGNEDANRQSTVRGMMQAIFKRVKEKPVTEYPRIIEAAANCVTTDLSSVSLLLLASDMGTNTTFYSATGPYAGEIDENLNSWLCYENPAGWARLMEVVDAGEDPSGITYDEDEVTYPSTGEVVIPEENVEETY